MASRTDEATLSVSRPGPSFYFLPEDEGAGLLDFAHVDEAMTAGYNYWVASAGEDGLPHCMPVWGVWGDGSFVFSTGPTTRKGRNLLRNPWASVHLESGEQVVVVEGPARELRDRDEIERFRCAYNPKYDWDFALEDLLRGVFCVRMERAFAWLGSREEVFRGTATRWTVRPAPGRPPPAIDHVALPCFDSEATLEFYTEVLGLELVSAFEGEGGQASPPFLMMAFAAASGARIDFFEYAGVGRPPRGDLPRAIPHLALTVRTRAGLEAWARRFDEKSVSYQRERSGAEEGSLYVADPNGHVVELSCHPPAERAPDASPRDVVARWARKRATRAPE